MSRYYKYPRTPHLNWSPGVSRDDLKLNHSLIFEGREVVVTEKMDGENTTMYPDHIHARSLDSRHHPSRDWVKALHGQIAYMIPEGWRICGENMYARHSIAYEHLRSYFYVFSVWNQENMCLSWQDTETWVALWGLVLPPLLYQGTWDEAKLRNMRFHPDKQEGYVVRSSQAFHYDAFGQHVAKWVRADHVQTDQHWMHKEIIPNRLAKEEKP